MFDNLITCFDIIMECNIIMGWIESDELNCCWYCDTEKFVIVLNVFSGLLRNFFGTIVVNEIDWLEFTMPPKKK